MKLLKFLILFAIALVGARAADIVATYPLGSKVTIRVTVGTGTPPFTYQWKKLNTSGVFAPIQGATSDTLTFASAQALDAGTYTVTVSNPTGSVTAANYAVLRVNLVIIPGNLQLSFEPAPTL